MILDELRCSDCGSTELIAAWPGTAGDRCDLFQLTAERPMRCWCQQCWLKRYGRKPAPPQRGGKAKAAALT